MGVIDDTYGILTSQAVTDLNPVFGEDFVWALPNDEDRNLENIVLKVKVWDWDIFYDDMGAAEIKLDDLELSGTPTAVNATVDSNWFSDDGMVSLTIAYRTV